jgi:hypothetical protein
MFRKMLVLAVLISLILAACSAKNQEQSHVRMIQITATGFEISSQFRNDPFPMSDKRTGEYIEYQTKSYLKVFGLAFPRVTATAEPYGPSSDPRFGSRRFRMKNIVVDGKKVTEEILGTNICDFSERAAIAIYEAKTGKLPEFPLDPYEER